MTHERRAQDAAADLATDALIGLASVVMLAVTCFTMVVG